jgi:uncharacterized phage-associated protein
MDHDSGIGSGRPLMKFAFHEGKAIEAMALIAKLHPGVTPLYVSKMLFFAEKWHLNRYGRPILADTFIAMPKGPVPSTIKNFIDHNWAWVDKPAQFEEAVKVQKKGGFKRLYTGTREPNLDLLSKTDVDCITEAVDFCKDKDPEELSLLTHHERSWREADANGAMDYELFIDEDNPNRQAILAIARETAACGIL